MKTKATLLAIVEFKKSGKEPPTNTTNFKLMVVTADGKKVRRLVPDINELDVRPDTMGNDRVFTKDGLILLDPDPEMEPEGQILVDNFAIQFLKHNPHHYCGLLASSKKVFCTKIGAYVGDKKSSPKFQSLCHLAEMEGLNDQYVAHGLAPVVATHTNDINNIKKQQEKTSKDVVELQKQQKKTSKDVAELGEDLTILYKDFDHLAAWAESKGYVLRGDGRNGSDDGSDNSDCSDDGDGDNKENETGEANLKEDDDDDSDGEEELPRLQRDYLGFAINENGVRYRDLY